jgi:hypothetical protein
MYCRVCGDENGVRFRPACRQSLCGPCAKDTPKKASRESFEKRYWGAELKNVPNSTRDEFWSDYLASTKTLVEYIDATTTTVY